MQEFKNNPDSFSMLIHAAIDRTTDEQRRKEREGHASPFSHSSTVRCCSIAWYLFGEVLSVQRLIGIAIILVGVLVLARS